MDEQTPARDSAVSRSPGRPRAFDTDTVLDEALELFWKRGYRTTTTRDLESALGLKQSSIYNAFGSKQDLLELALDRYETITSEALLEPLEQSKDGLVAIDDFFVGLARWVTHKGRRGCMLINMMAEDGDATASITERSRAYRNAVRTALRNALGRAVQTDGIQNTALEERADLLIGMVLGLNIAARGGAGVAELGCLLDAVRMEVRSWRPTGFPS